MGPDRDGQQGAAHQAILMKTGSRATGTDTPMRGYSGDVVPKEPLCRRNAPLMAENPGATTLLPTPVTGQDLGVAEGI